MDPPDADERAQHRRRVGAVDVLADVEVPLRDGLLAVPDLPLGRRPRRLGFDRVARGTIRLCLV